MPTTAVIVALPSPLDPIRLIGDEVKHATILNFGEISTLPDGAKNELLGTIAQAAKMTAPFRDRITQISRLGSDNPPALVAMLAGIELTKIRNTLQVNPRVGDYLKNVAQFPSYTPHMTLAFPDIMGEIQLRKQVEGLFRVGFDRLALWWGDEQIEFDLAMWGEDAVPADAEMAMSAGELGVYLVHHGVKGMKWGVRRERGADGTVTGTKKTAGKKSAAKKAASKPSSGPSRSKRVAAFVKKKVEDRKNKPSPQDVKKAMSAKDVKLSADAEKLVKARMRPTHEMSDAEIQEALRRARLVEDYNRFFSPAHDPHLQDQVNHLNLQKSYGKVHSELHPSTTAKALALVSAASAGYLAYTKLNKASDGALGKTISSTLNVAFDNVAGSSGGKHKAGVAVAKKVAEKVA